MLYIILFLFCFIYFWNFYFLIKKCNLIYAIMHPINFFSIYAIIFFILPIYIGNFYVPMSIGYLDVSENIEYVLYVLLGVYILLSMVNIYNNSYIDKKKMINESMKYGNTLEFFLSLYIFFIFCVLCILILESGGLAVIINDFAEFTIKARNGNTFLLMIIYSIEIIPIFYLLVSQKVSHVFLSFVTIIAMLFVSLVGARVLIVSIIIGLIVVLLRKEEINITKFLKFSIFCILFFVLGSLVRVSGEDSNDLTIQERKDALILYWSNNSDQLFTTLYVINKIENDQLNYQFGYTIIDAIYFFIPSKIWEDKPKSYYPSRLVYGDIISSGIENNTKLTINFGMIARPYLDFGIFGVLVLNFLVFIFLYKKYNDIIFPCKKQKNIKVLQNVYIYSHIHQIYILGIWSHVIAIIIFNMVIISVIYYNYLIFRKVFQK